MTPLDVVKVRLQGDHRSRHLTRNLLSATETFAKVLKTEGWTSLYRGFLPTIAMSLPGTVVYFVGYERTRELLLGSGGGLVHEQLVPSLAGSMARVFAATSVSPLELVRTRMQFKGVEKGKLGVVCGELWHLVRQDGLRVLWRGLQPTLWRDVPFSALYWTILEPSKKLLQTLSANETEVSSPLSNAAISFTCGAFAGSIAAALTTPFDVAKTRQQLILNRTDFHQISKSAGFTSNCPSSTWIQLKEIWREAGWHGLTRGMGPRVAKVAPACAIMIGSYEFGKSIFHESKSKT